MKEIHKYNLDNNSVYYTVFYFSIIFAPRLYGDTRIFVTNMFIFNSVIVYLNINKFVYSQNFAHRCVIVTTKTYLVVSRVYRLHYLFHSKNKLQIKIKTQNSMWLWLLQILGGFRTTDHVPVRIWKKLLHRIIWLPDYK